MLLRAVRLRNFRSYRDEVTVELKKLTAFVGRNDVGKSTVFDALAIFFGQGPIDSRDRCVHVDRTSSVSITCIFENLPEKLVLDQTATTTLQDERLLNSDGLLEIKKTFSGDNMKEEVFAVCVHPSAAQAKDLLATKNADLKKQAAALGVAESADKRSNVELRAAIRGKVADLKPSLTELSLAKEGAKEIWSALEVQLPFFALFRADRPSTDEDAEIQDPMRLAVRQALKELQPQLQEIQDQVEQRAREVAEKTLEKLTALDERIASTLKPRYRAEPKWDSVFKLALDGENDIPINKRGSGVRRLVLLSFFQAEVERKCSEKAPRDVIYAIEEPETSQHPTNQILLVEALKELVADPRCQVLLTTHVPALAGMLPVEGIRHVTQDAQTKRAIDQGERILKAIADDLGVLPDFHDPRCQVIVCVEGPTDVEFLRNVSKAIRTIDPSMPDLANDARVAILPMGGDTLKDWINKRYLQDLRLPEVHLYDSDVPEYATACADVNNRSDGLGSVALQTVRREIENYYPDVLVSAHFGITLSIAPTDDVEALVAAALGGQRKFKRKSIKRNLAEDVAPLITEAHLRALAVDAEVLSWFSAIKARVR